MDNPFLINFLSSRAGDWLHLRHGAAAAGSFSEANLLTPLHESIKVAATPTMLPEQVQY
jgi:hypothetical protein